nr:benzoate carboxyl methyltransferase [Tanacetum cinerariifolium]
MGELFPDKSIHLFHSSGSLHWLSQVPEGLEINGLNVYMAKTSPPVVFEMYRTQFQKDFAMFLESRSKEMIHGGHMVLSLAGRSDVDPSCNDSGCLWEMFANSLVDMAKEGLVKESDIKSFNVPTYNLYKDAVTDLIHKEGSFSLDLLESYELNWDPYDTDYANVKVSDEPIHGKKVANVVRAAAEPMLIAHFGHSAMDFVFQKFETYVNEHLSTEKTKHHVIIWHDDKGIVAGDKGVAISHPAVGGHHVITKSVSRWYPSYYGLKMFSLRIVISSFEMLRVDASIMLPKDKVVTREDTEGVIGAEIRNQPDLATYPGSSQWHDDKGIVAGDKGVAISHPAVGGHHVITKSVSRWYPSYYGLKMFSLRIVISSFEMLRVDASIMLPKDKVVTREDTEGVIGAEIRNQPDLATYPGGVAATMAAAARLNEKQ